MRRYGRGFFHAGAIAVDLARDAGGRVALVPPAPGALAEVLDAATGGVVVRIRNVAGEPGFDAPAEAAAHELARVLAGRPGADVTVASFDWYAIAVARDAGLRTGFATPPGLALDAALAYAVEARHAECHPHWSAVAEDPAAVAKARAAGVAVVAWGVPDAAACAALRAAGVDGVVAADPAALHDD